MSASDPSTPATDTHPDGGDGPPDHMQQPGRGTELGAQEGADRPGPPEDPSTPTDEPGEPTAPRATPAGGSPTSTGDSPSKDGDQLIRERTPQPPVMVTDLAAQLHDEAAAASNGRASASLTPGQGSALKQTVVALREGTTVGPKTWTLPATVLVLEGEGHGAGLTVETGSWFPLQGGDELHATTAMALLLTTGGGAHGDEDGR